MPKTREERNAARRAVYAKRKAAEQLSRRFYDEIGFTEAVYRELRAAIIEADRRGSKT